MQILVTGGNGGLGKAIVGLLKLHDHEVITMGREGCDYNIDFGERSWLLQDFLIRKKIEADGVIHCAGTNHIDKNNHLKLEKITELFVVNALSNFIINRYFMFDYSDEERGLQFICHVISDAAWTPMTNSFAYNVSKAAQLMAMRQMAHEWKPWPVIFGVSPGKINDTGMSDYIDRTFPPLRGMTFEEGRKYQLSRLRTGEMGAKQVAEFICYLCLSANPHYHGHNFQIGG